MIIHLACIHFYVKTPKIVKNNFEVTICLRKDREISVRYIVKVNKIFQGRSRPRHTINNAEFFLNFIILNLP
jgi:hypothetical protein